MSGLDSGVPENIENAPGWLDLYDLAAADLGDRHEARWIVEEASGATWSELIATTSRVPSKARIHYDEMVERRREGEPLQYVLGRWGFRSLDLMVDRRVLIPRPETEQVVEVALTELDRAAAAKGGAEEMTVADLGTGSGAIALAIATERRRVQVWATDAEPAALDVARANLAGVAGFAATRVRMVEGRWWAALPDELRHTLDLVVSNPPYISTTEMRDLEIAVRDWEPRSALESGPSGLEAVEEIVSGAGEWLAPHGAVVIEIAPHQAEDSQKLAMTRGFGEVEVLPDLAGRDRILVARAWRRL